MKRAGFLTEQIADTDNLLLAFYKASTGKKMKAEVRRFSSNLSSEIGSLRQEILEGNVRVGDYSYFHIRDPKPRLICAAAFRERVLHHALMNICHPYFERQFIETTYATRPGKGIYQALERTRKAAKRYDFVAKFDFRKYFDSIDHGLLKRKLRRIFKDTRLLAIFDAVIGSYCREEGKGLPIGNLTSQYFANYYLSGMDHYCKEVLGIGEYIRYMDDFLVFASSRTELDRWVEAVKEYARSQLLLELKPVVCIQVSEGIPFLGYRVFSQKILLNTRSKQRLRKKIRLYEGYVSAGQWSEQEYSEHILPLLAFARFAYTKGLRHSILTAIRNKAPTA